MAVSAMNATYSAANDVVAESFYCGYKHGGATCNGNKNAKCCDWWSGTCGTGMNCDPQFCADEYGLCSSVPFLLRGGYKRDLITVTAAATTQTMTVSASTTSYSVCNGFVLQPGETSIPSTACGFWSIFPHDDTSSESPFEHTTTPWTPPQTSQSSNTQPLTTTTSEQVVAATTVVETEATTVNTFSVGVATSTPTFSGRLDPHPDSKGLKTDVKAHFVAAVAGMMACALLACLL